jgi:hypothetical protein
MTGAALRRTIWNHRQYSRKPLPLRARKLLGVKADKRCYLRREVEFRCLFIGHQTSPLLKDNQRLNQLIRGL